MADRSPGSVTRWFGARPPSERMSSGGGAPPAGLELASATPFSFGAHAAKRSVGGLWLRPAGPDSLPASAHSSHHGGIFSFGKRPCAKPAGLPQPPPVPLGSFGPGLPAAAASDTPALFMRQRPSSSQHQRQQSLGGDAAAGAEQPEAVDLDFTGRAPNEIAAELLAMSGALRGGVGWVGRGIISCRAASLPVPQAKAAPHRVAHASRLCSCPPCLPRGAAGPRAAPGVRPAHPGGGAARAGRAPPLQRLLPHPQPRRLPGPGGPGGRVGRPELPAVAPWLARLLRHQQLRHPGRGHRGAQAPRGIRARAWGGP
jgi:hypothetical protein